MRFHTDAKLVVNKRQNTGLDRVAYRVRFATAPTFVHVYTVCGRAAIVHVDRWGRAPKEEWSALRIVRRGGNGGIWGMGPSIGTGDNFLKEKEEVVPDAWEVDRAERVTLPKLRKALMEIQDNLNHLDEIMVDSNGYLTRGRPHPADGVISSTGASAWGRIVGPNVTGECDEDRRADREVLPPEHRPRVSAYLRAEEKKAEEAILALETSVRGWRDVYPTD